LEALMHARQRLLAGSAALAMLVAPFPAAAQQFGKLYTMTGHAFRPEPRPATDELIATLTVPEGFRRQVFARDVGNPRMMVMAADRTLYVTRPASNDVVALSDRDGDGKADGGPRVVAANLDRVHGIALRDGRIYLATVHEIYAGRIADDGSIADLAAVIDDLPGGGQHALRTIRFGPDGRLFVQIGSSCNDCLETEEGMAAISVINPGDWSRRVFAKGLRNSMGFDWHPESGQMWGADHGSEWRGDDVPPDELNRIEDGKHYGWPFCWGDRQPDWLSPAMPEDGTPKPQFCQEQTEAPVLEFAAHSAPIDLLFYDGQQFPADYLGDAFVTQRGSWNRETPIGYGVVRVNFEAGEPKQVEDFLFRFLTNDRKGTFGRVAGLALANDGSLLVSDDMNGVIYRVTYEGHTRQAESGRLIELPPLPPVGLIRPTVAPSGVAPTE
jgi:glucose/arabinose dehydrogenase